MNDVAAAPGQVAPQSDAAGSGGGFGAALQAARGRAGLSVQEVAARLRLHPKQLVALEGEQLDLLPATPFVSGFVRNCARELGVEPGPLLDDLHAKLAARGLPGPMLDLRGPDASRMPVLDERRWRQLVMTVIIGVLICAGLIGAWMARSHGQGPVAARQSARALAPAPAAEPQARRADPAPPATQPDAGPSAGPPSPAIGVNPSAPAIPPAPTPAPAVAAPTASAAPNAPGGTARPAGTGLVLRFNERSWVEVTQPDGRVLMSRTGEPGSLELLNAAVPMQLVVGRADAVEVEYRGQPVNLKPYVNGNGVARLTLADGRISAGGPNAR